MPSDTWRARAGIARALGQRPPEQPQRMLASAGIFEETESNRFSLTPEAALLQTHAPGSMRTGSMATELEYPAWRELLCAVMTDVNAFQRAFGEPGLGGCECRAHFFDGAHRSTLRRVLLHSSGMARLCPRNPYRSSCAGNQFELRNPAAGSSKWTHSRAT